MTFLKYVQLRRISISFPSFCGDGCWWGRKLDSFESSWSQSLGSHATARWIIEDFKLIVCDGLQSKWSNCHSMLDKVGWDHDGGDKSPRTSKSWLVNSQVLEARCFTTPELICEPMIFVLTLQDERNMVATNAFRFRDPELQASVCQNAKCSQIY